MNPPASPVSLPLHERTSPGGPDRPTLVFLHYFGGSGRTWGMVMDALAPQGWNGVAPDLRGFGESPAPGDTPDFFTVDAMAGDVHALVSRSGWRRFILVGHSMGGKVALALAAKRPAGLAGVVLLAPSPPTPEPMEDAERARLLRGYGDPASVKETLGKITACPLPPPVFDAAVADTLRASAPAWRAWLEHGSHEDVSARMRSVTAPVRVAVGSEDETITASLVEHEISARLARTGTFVETLPGVGHLLPLEAPAATVDFLAGAFARFEAVGPAD